MRCPANTFWTTASPMTILTSFSILLNSVFNCRPKFGGNAYFSDVSPIIQSLAWRMWFDKIQSVFFFLRNEQNLAALRSYIRVQKSGGTRPATHISPKYIVNTTNITQQIYIETYNYFVTYCKIYINKQIINIWHNILVLLVLS